MGLAAAAPTLGEHTAEVLAELGFAATDVDDMVARGVAGPTAGDGRHHVDEVSNDVGNDR